MQTTLAKRVLIIDDALDNQVLLRLLLESKGYVVDCTSNGQEALDLLVDQDGLPDVILVDLRMPVMDGLDFLRWKRDSSRFRDIPTVVMSAEGDRATIRAKTAPFDLTNRLGILTKPLNMASVLKSVERSSYLH